MDNDLRVGIWNVLDIYIWTGAGNESLHYIPDYRTLASRLWIHYFKWAHDTMPSDWPRVEQSLRKYFFACDWDEAYDFLEFIAMNTADWRNAEPFSKAVNVTLERELSAFRLVGGNLAEVTSPSEVAAIEEALAGSSSPFRTHLQSALVLFSDRQTPDYRNSIRESISAVESLVNALVGSKGTLGQALKKLDVQAHPALEGAFNQLYGYTSDANGIRHALMDESNLEAEDAKFMLVSCSAFVNYLVAKGARSGIVL